MPPSFRQPPRATSNPPVRRWLGRVPLLLGLPLLLLGGIGLAGPYLHPGHFWWVAIAAVILPYVVALLLLVTLLMIATRQWAGAVLSCAVIALSLIRLAPIDRVATSIEPQDDDLVVMTFSVPRFGGTVESLASDVLDLLERERPDLIALQETMAWRRTEAPGTPRIADYMQLALDSLGYVVAIPAQLTERRTPLPVLTRRSGGPIILEQREGALADDARAGRYVRTRLRWQGREAILYNVHLRGYGAAKPWEEARFPLLRPSEWAPFLRRYRDAFRLRGDEVRVLQAHLDREEHPVILAGDLNVTSRNWDYRQLARDRTDAFRAAGRGWGATYRGDIPMVRIDFVLSDPEFTAVRAHVPRVRFSDHRPVVARLRWSGEESEISGGSPSVPTGIREPNPARSP